MSNLKNRLALLAVALIACAVLAFLDLQLAAAAGGFTLLGTGFLIGDALLKVTRALPSAASTTVNSSGINLDNGTRGDFVADAELLLTYPALTTTMLPDTRTMTYNIQHDTDSAFGTAVTLASAVVVQTGAGGAGAVGGTFRFRPPTNCKQYVRLQIVSGASTTDSSTTSATLQLMT